MNEHLHAVRPERSAARPILWRWGDPPEQLERHWQRGGLVAIPTESSYGLAVDPRQADAVAAVFRCKGRPADRPLPVVAGSQGDLTSLGVDLASPALRPAVAAWPAALTVVAPLDRPLAAACGRSSLAVRIPDHRQLRELLATLQRAVTATSANRYGEPPVCKLAAACELLRGERAMVIDGGDLPGGAPSTIVGIRDETLIVLREGRFDWCRPGGT